MEKVQIWSIWLEKDPLSSTKTIYENIKLHEIFMRLKKRCFQNKESFP